MSFSEKDKKVTVTIGLIMTLVAAAFFLGTLWEKNQSLQSEVKGSKDFTEQEVGGLRSDWERHNLIVKEQMEEMRADWKKDLENFEKIYHGKK